MQPPSLLSGLEPPRDCPHCPRLVALRHHLRTAQPDWWNAPVPAFGDPHAWLAVIGLAPGLRGANRTGRAFTGDHAGDLLFTTLARFGFTQGRYDGSADDGLRLGGAIILNAVKCLPPKNKPSREEIRSCRPHLAGTLAALPHIEVVVALGRIAHESVVEALGERSSKMRFGHLARHSLPGRRLLIDSYHCSRYNTNTGRLTAAMFDAVFPQAIEFGKHSR